MLHYLPDPKPSNLAVFVASDANVQEVRQRIQNIGAENHLLIFSDRDLRTEARVLTLTTVFRSLAIPATPSGTGAVPGK